MAVAEAGNKACSQAAKEEKVTQVVVVAAAVNQAAPGSQPFVMTDAQFNRWMTAQGK